MSKTNYQFDLVNEGHGQDLFQTIPNTNNNKNSNFNQNHFNNPNSNINPRPYQPNVNYNNTSSNDMATNNCFKTDNHNVTGHRLSNSDFNES